MKIILLLLNIQNALRIYQDLYSSKKKVPKPDINIDEEQIPDITRDEVKKALKDMKKDKAPGEVEVLKEFLKEGGERT